MNLKEEMSQLEEILQTDRTQINNFNWEKTQNHLRKIKPIIEKLKKVEEINNEIKNKKINYLSNFKEIKAHLYNNLAWHEFRNTPEKMDFKLEAFYTYLDAAKDSKKISSSEEYYQRKEAAKIADEINNEIEEISYLDKFKLNLESTNNNYELSSKIINYLESKRIPSNIKQEDLKHTILKTITQLANNHAYLIKETKNENYAIESYKKEIKLIRRVKNVFKEDNFQKNKLIKVSYKELIAAINLYEHNEFSKEELQQLGKELVEEVDLFNKKIVYEMHKKIRRTAIYAKNIK